MERLIWQVCCLSVGLFWLFPEPLNAAAVEKDLQGIKKKIEQEKQGISQAQKKEGSVLQSLREIEGELGKKTKHLNQTQARLNSILAEMNKKQAEENRLRRSIGQRQQLLEKRAVALYRWFRGGSPFVILNGNVSFGPLSQRSHYLKATVSFDRELIEKLTEEARQQNLLRVELERKREELTVQKLTLDEARQEFRSEAEKKKQMLASLRQEKATRMKALKELEQAALRLQKMIDEIAKASVAKSRQAPAGSGLEAMRGKFDWPVKGELAGVFGKTRHREFSAEVFRKGIDIEAPFGEQIKAVEKGKVVYADRFAGYGKMIIIDHGDRFYTIYAHLAEMLKKTGDTVSRGETVGLVGDSDSLAGAKLYFEMRKDGRSIDPLPWFRKY
ncbi:MAG TPA: peptidoglycan DD-metalloendopeptidase family protein [Candidatus Binatia bacterium]|nr:peptidoglycan DD-metalloendopeptidase family protein [Candidatus Binatia bacterium]